MGPMGMTARTFRDPEGSNRVGLIVEVPDIDPVCLAGERRTLVSKCRARIHLARGRSDREQLCGLVIGGDLACDPSAHASEQPGSRRCV